MKQLAAKTQSLSKMLRREYRRIVAFMLTIAMTFTNIGTNLTVAFAAGEDVSSLFLIDGEELREAIDDVLQNGGGAI